MDCPRILLILTVASICMVSLLVEARNMDWMTGDCSCTVNFSNQEVTYINNCEQRFEPKHEVLVMPMHPGTGNPKVKIMCICRCELDLDYFSRLYY